MLKQLILENWKSFRHAVLDIDTLTILIGTNASGKSNALEALEFLKRTAWGKEIQAALTGDITLSSIRGGWEWATFKLKTELTLEVLVQGRDDSIDYLYSITVGTIPRVQIYAESLSLIKQPSNKGSNLVTEKIFQTKNVSIHSPSIKAELYVEKNVIELEFVRSHSILSQVKGLSMKMTESILIVSQALTNIFILEPIPSKMRSYSTLSDHLQSDASNIAGLLAALPDEQKKEVESTILNYMKHLPERDIQRVWAETVGRFKSDAMLYCEEQWIPAQPPMLIDARGMSDGTLRFLAILTALLTRPKGSQLIIEDVDNGLHPSRSELLVKMLKEIGEQRNIDILVTTHNPALLDALGPEIVPFVVVAHRDKETGESKLTLLEDIENLPKLMASGSLGKLTANGAIERSLSGNR